jgi:hypothetical protein
MKIKHASLCSGGLILLLGIAVAYAWGAQREGIEQDMYPRTLEMLDVGYELPMEIVAIRHLQRKEHWLRDLEIEIKNVSAKSIYGVYFTLSMPDDNARGAPTAVGMGYGRFELVHPKERASASDRPIRPSETAIITVPEPEWRGYERHLGNDRVPEEATQKLRIAIVAINLGDGTGFINGGVPYPDRPPTRLRPYQYVRVPIDSK